MDSWLAGSLYAVSRASFVLVNNTDHGAFMLRSKVVTMCILASFGASAVASASASAAADVWTVAGAEVKGGETFAVESEATGQVAWKFGWNTLGVECKKLTTKAGLLEKEGKASAMGITFEECDVTSPAKECEVEGGKITTTANAATLETSGAKHLLKITPVGGTFATFKFVGAGCGSVKGSHSVKGKVTCEGGGTEAELETEALKHKLRCNVTTASGELLWGEEGASLSGEVGLKLASGANWSM